MENEIIFYKKTIYKHLCFYLFLFILSLYLLYSFKDIMNLPFFLFSIIAIIITKNNMKNKVILKVNNETLFLFNKKNIIKISLKNIDEIYSNYIYNGDTEASIVICFNDNVDDNYIKNLKKRLAIISFKKKAIKYSTEYSGINPCKISFIIMKKIYENLHSSLLPIDDKIDKGSTNEN